MNECGLYWKDENGNMWSKDQYTELEAQEMSSTLVDCHGCLDCEYLQRSSFCTRCSASSDLLDCTHCQDCENCRWSENLVTCERCESCANLLGASDQKLVCLTPEEYNHQLAMALEERDEDDDYDYDYYDDCDYDYGYEDDCYDPGEDDEDPEVAEARADEHFADHDDSEQETTYV